MRRLPQVRVPPRDSDLPHGRGAAGGWSRGTFSGRLTWTADLPRNVGIKLNDKDIGRATDLLKYQLDALAKKDFRYPTKTSLPESSKRKTGWIDPQWYPSVRSAYCGRRGDPCQTSAHGRDPAGCARRRSVPAAELRHRGARSHGRQLSRGSWVAAFSSPELF